MLKINTRSLFVAILFVSLSLFGCKKTEVFTDKPDGGEGFIPKEPAPALATIRSWLVDKNATEQTAALFYNLKESSKSAVLFGHQDDTKRGLTGSGGEWANEEHLPAGSNLRSDVKDVAGAFPALYGWDFNHIAGFDKSGWFQYEAKIARELTVEAYNRGGVNTYAWHYANPVSKGSFYWNDSPVEAVSRILPGGDHHEIYKRSLQEVAAFAGTLVGTNGTLVPVIFRPFHELDGDWFWWGRAHCSTDQYISLYRFTVTYLRDELGVRNFLYAWSPDRNFNSEIQYLERYPGDEYVDLVGVDNYQDLQPALAPGIASAKLKIVSDYAGKKNKLAALTETGLQNLTKSDWYTAMLLKVLQYQKVDLAYVMVWANRKDAYWTPYKGHPAETDFRNFKTNPYIRFGDNMPAMYTIK